MLNRILRAGCAVALLAILSAARADAAPVLQLDIIDGKYDWSTKTIVAQDDVFQLLAVFTPQSWMSPARVLEYLSDTYYVAAAVTPATHWNKDLGQFTFDTDAGAGWTPETVAVTGGMQYGNPPVELLESHATYDPGDVEPHGIYNTYFREFSFQFTPLQQTAVYDSQLQRDGFTGVGTGAYYALFTVDTTALSDTHRLHFDLYSTKLKDCTLNSTCSDEDLALLAPFSHDAQSAPVPEPATLLLVGSGAALAFRRRFRRQQTA